MERKYVGRLPNRKKENSSPNWQRSRPAPRRPITFFMRAAGSFCWKHTRIYIDKSVYYMDLIRPAARCRADSRCLPLTTCNSRPRNLIGICRMGHSQRWSPLGVRMYTLVDYFISQQLRNPNNFLGNSLETAGCMQILFFVYCKTSTHKSR